MWYKNHAHADWGMVAWQAVVAALSSRAWDPSIPSRTMVERFTSLVSCIDAHLPDGIKDIIRVWFETAGAERMMEVTDEEWHMMEHITLSLSSSGVLLPEIVLNGLLFPVWNHAYRLDAGADYSQALARTLPLAGAMLLCDPLGNEGEKLPRNGSRRRSVVLARHVHRTSQQFCEAYMRWLYLSRTKQWNPA